MRSQIPKTHLPQRLWGPSAAAFPWTPARWTHLCGPWQLPLPSECSARHLPPCKRDKVTCAQVEKTERRTRPPQGPSLWEVTEAGPGPDRSYPPVTPARALRSPPARASKAPAKGLLHESRDHPDALPPGTRVSDSISLEGQGLGAGKYRADLGCSEPAAERKVALGAGSGTKAGH